jgi:hypothetical protein
MKRLTALMFCLVVCGLAAAAPKSKDEVVTLDVQPAPAPVPALKYQLLPEVAEMNPGNAVPAYFKCYAEQNNFFFNKEVVEERFKILNGPLSDIKPGQLKNYGGHALKQADHAARLEYADWNMLPQMREHGYMLLIPEVQQMRGLANALAVRCRGQIADKDFDGAIRSFKTIFALARHLGDHPTIISGLVGSAIAQVGLRQLEDFVQQPGAPNLYWALTTLPPELVDIRKGVSADRIITEATFGFMMDKNRIWDAKDLAAANQKFKEFGAILDLNADDRTAVDSWIRERHKDEPWLAEARKGLADAGYPAEAIGKYPPEQVLFYHLFRKSRVHHDEAVKWIPVPYWQSEGPLAELEKAPGGVEDKLTRQMVFAVTKVKTAHLRTAQRFALLRTVEAIRLDAAANGGKLPASLSDLSVPVPADPGTGKPFAYKLDGMTATLEARPSKLSDGGTLQYRYEIRLRK